MTKSITKAERIFDQTMMEARRAIRIYGIGFIDAVALCCEGTDGIIAQRTINAITKQLDNYERR